MVNQIFNILLLLSASFTFMAIHFTLTTSLQIDTIAADHRFQPGTQALNFEVRTVGPITKHGIYLAIQVIFVQFQRAF